MCWRARLWAGRGPPGNYTGRTAYTVASSVASLAPPSMTLREVCVPKMPPPDPSHTRSAGQWRDSEVEVVDGLEEFAEQELERELGADARVVGRPVDGRISVGIRGDARRLSDLRAVTAVHLVHRFDVARPRALLGHQNLQALLQMFQEVVSLHPAGTFETFRISAAGGDSRVFSRLKEEVGSEIGLTHIEGPSHLQIAVRRPPDGSRGWQVLVRTTPKPLTARAWRVCDYPGALNAAVANVMVGLAGPSDSHRFLNLCCGSGTLMIERLASDPAASVVGIDHSLDALKCASENLRAAAGPRRVGAPTVLLRGDVGAVPLPAASVEEIVADLPYGMLVEGDGDIRGVYEAAVREATRLAMPRASLVVITVRKRLFESTMGAVWEKWDRVRTVGVRVPFQSGYITPTIYVFERIPT